MKIRNIVWGMVLGCVMVSCGGNRQEAGKGDVVSDGTLVFEPYSFDVIARFTGDTIVRPGGGCVRLRGEGVLPRDLGEANLQLLRDSLMRMAGVKLAGDRYEPVIGENMVLTDVVPDSAGACGFSRVQLSASMVNPRVVVFEADREGYSCGAAHGNRAVRYVNYSVPASHILSLGDLLVAGYEDKLVRLIKANLEESGVSLLVEPEDIGVASQFAITPQGLLFSYDPYEIAPYSEGVVEVEISSGALVQQGLLTPEATELLSAE